MRPPPHLPRLRQPGHNNVKCPSCQSKRVKVTDSRQRNNRRYRKRLCNDCGHYFSTTELPGTVTTSHLPLLPLTVEKKDGTIAPFDRNKLMYSLMAAVLKSRRDNVPISDIVSQIEQEGTVALGEPIKTTAIGEQVLQALRAHDRLAYVRYLSRHKPVATAADIQTLIDELQALLAAPSGNGDNNE